MRAQWWVPLRHAGAHAMRAHRPVTIARVLECERINAIAFPHRTHRKDKAMRRGEGVKARTHTLTRFYAVSAGTIGGGW